jgi:hypothetical protein
MQYAIPVSGDSVEILECVKEMLRVFSPNVLDTKVVNDKGEGDVASVVSPESWGSRSGGIAVFGEMLVKLLVGNEAG